MLARKLSWLLSLLLITRLGLSQQDVSSFEHLLKVREATLFTYSADPDARYRWANDQVIPKVPEVRSFGAFVTKSVTLQNNMLLIHGEQAPFMTDKRGSLVMQSIRRPMTIEIDLGTADPASVLPKLTQAIFYPDQTAARDGLPVEVREIVTSQGRKVVRSGSSWISDNGKWIQLAAKDPSYRNPRPVLLPELHHSEEARRARASGTVRLLLHVMVSGQVGDVWLLSRAGFGLDEEAVSVAKRSRFTPATYQGRPVTTSLQIESNFEGY